MTARGDTTGGARVLVIAVAVLSGAWLLMVILTNPSGDFPLNDDWNYAHSVKALLESGRYVVTVWSLAASVTHVLAGSLAALLFGFSFETLRLTTLCWGLLGLVAIFALVRQAGGGFVLPLLGAATVMVNPLFFELSHTFMTDVPFFALAILSLVLLSRALAADSPGGSIIWWSAAAVVAACLSRQTGLVIPLAFALAALWGRERLAWRHALLPLTAAVAAVALFQIWLSSTGAPPFAYLAERAYLQAEFAKGAVHIVIATLTNMIRALVYLGLFLLPMLTVCFPFLLSRLSKAEKLFTLALSAELAILIGAGLLFTGSLMPLADNVLFDLGLGPILLPGSEAWPQAPRQFWLVVTMAGTAGGSLLTALLVTAALRLRASFKSGKVSPDDRLLLLHLAVIVLYGAVIAVRGFFDRYLIVPIPSLAFVIVSLAAVPTDPERRPGARAALAAAIVLLAGFGAFSVMATHDYLAWNRARWEALRYLTGPAAVPPLEIDGGLEFNGWVAYEPAHQAAGIVFDTGMKHGDRYLVSMAAVAGYESLRSYPFRRWLPPGTGRILILKRSPERTI